MRISSDGLERPCTKCGGEKDGSHPSYCKACFAAYVKARRDANIEEAREKERTRYWENVEWNRERQRIWRDENSERAQTREQEWRAAKPVEERQQYRRNRTLKERGLTPQEFEAMMEEQAGMCLVCNAVMESGRGAKAVCIDHDHQTGDIRGLLCSNCNRAIGLFEEDPDRMVAAAAYIMRWNATRELQSHETEGET